MTSLRNLLPWLLGALGPWALFWAALADSSFVPLLQAVDVMVVAQSVVAPRQAYLAALMATAGSTLGCLAAYLAARLGGRRLVERHVSAVRRERLRESFVKHGAWSLIVPTMAPLPLPMRLFVIGAGVFRMRVVSFASAILLARTVRYFGLAFIAVTFGERAILFFRERAWAVTGLLLVGASLWILWRKSGSIRVKLRKEDLEPCRKRLEVLGREVVPRHHEPSPQDVVEAPAHRVRQNAPAVAGDPRGAARPGEVRPPHPGAPDSDSPLQSLLHVLQRI